MMLSFDRIIALQTPSWHVGVISYSLVYACLAFIFAIHFHYNLFSNPVIYFIAVALIAGRQHSLYILNHDASHGSLFPGKNTNRWVATLLSIVPMLNHPEAWSFVQWRRIHLCHHQFLLTENDPNYLSRKNAGDATSGISHRKLLIKCLLSAPLSIYQFVLGKQDTCLPRSMRFKKNDLYHVSTLFKIYQDDPEMNQELCVKWLCFIGAITLIIYLNLWLNFLLLWIVPMYTIYPMILTYYDLTEHHWEVISTDLQKNTRSSHKLFITRIFLSFFHRGYHREHHMFPRIPALRLKQWVHDDR